MVISGSSLTFDTHRLKNRSLYYYSHMTSPHSFQPVETQLWSKGYADVGRKCFRVCDVVDLILAHTEWKNMAADALATYVARASAAMAWCLSAASSSMLVRECWPLCQASRLQVAGMPHRIQDCFRDVCSHVVHIPAVMRRGSHEKRICGESTDHINSLWH